MSMRAFFAKYSKFKFNPEAAYRDEFARLAVEMKWRPPQEDKTAKAKKTGKTANPKLQVQDLRREHAISNTAVPSTEQITWSSEMSAQLKKQYKEAQKEYIAAITEEFNAAFEVEHQTEDEAKEDQTEDGTKTEIEEEANAEAEDDTKSEAKNKRKTRMEHQTPLNAWKNMCIQLGENGAEVPNDISKCKEIIESKFVNIYDLLESKRFKKKTPLFDTQEELRTYTKTTGLYFPLSQAYAGGLLRFLLKEILRPIGWYKERQRKRECSAKASAPE